MRPRPVVGEATVPDAVRRLLDKFDYPDREAQPQILPILPALGGGGAPTVVVAASNATELSKSKADLQCIGTDDHLTIQAAIGMLDVSIGGRILLTEGKFNVSTNQLDLGAVVNADVWLEGMGWFQTDIHTTDTSGSVVSVGNQSHISDLGITGSTTVGTHAGVGAGIGGGGGNVTVRNVGFSKLDTGIIIPGDDLWIIDSYFETLGSDAIADRGNVRADILIANNKIVTGHIDIDTSEFVAIVGNKLQGSIYGSPVGRVVIADNLFKAPPVKNTHVIELDDATNAPVDIVISGNLIEAAGGGGILLNGVIDSLIEGNFLDGTTEADAILLDLCEQANVVGNHIGGGGYLGRNGIHLTDTNDSLIEGNMIYQPGQDADATYDGILLDANSDRNDIWNNKIIGKAAANGPRYGINISAATCNDNSYLGNRTGPAADYSSGAYNDAGTATVNTWPGAAAPQGDNLL